MSTYSLTLRGTPGRQTKLSISEMDGNFLYLQDLVNSSGGGTTSVDIDTNQIVYGTGVGISSSSNFTFDPVNTNFAVGVNEQSICDRFSGSSQSTILSSNGGIIGSIGSTIIGGNSKVNNYDPNVCFTGSPYGGIIYNSKNSFITGGKSDSYESNGNTYIYNNPNLSVFSCDNIVIGGFSNDAFNSDHSSIIGGNCNCLCNSGGSSIIGSFNSRSSQNYGSSIIGGGFNQISCYSHGSSIIGGDFNKVTCSSFNSSILGGDYNKIGCFSSASTIIGGDCNNISCNSSKSTVVGGSRNHVESSCVSTIIGGHDNIILGSCGSVILGGSGLSLCNTNNTVLVDNLIVSGNLTDEFGNPIAGGGLIQGTYSEILTLKNNSDLVPGQKYLISDKADTGIILESTTHNEFLTTALGGFLNPDYQNVGTYSTVDGFNSYRGSWYYNIEDYKLIGTYNTYLRFRTSDSSVLVLSGSATTTQSTGFIKSVVDNNDGTYDILYVVITFSNVSFRDDVVLSFGGDDYSVYWIEDLEQGVIMGNITSNVGVTASISSSNTNTLILNNLNASFEGSGYIFDESGVYFTIDSIEYLRNGDVVISDGLHYEVTNWLAVNGYTPGDNIWIPGVSGAYYLLPKTIGNGYVEEWDPIDYDFDTNTIKLRKDKRGNVNYNIDFRWGDNNTRNNVTNFGSCNSVLGNLNPGEYQSQDGSNILGGGYNQIYNSCKSSIIGGHNNCIKSTTNFNNCGDSSIIGGHNNTVCNSRNTSVVGGYSNRVCNNSSNSTITGGGNNRICYNSRYSSIVGGYNNCLDYNSCYSALIGGQGSNIFYSCESSIIGGNNNEIYLYSDRSSIIGGRDNNMFCTSCSSILSGQNNTMCRSNDSSILSGQNNIMCNGSESIILGGNTNRLNNTCNSTVVGGDWTCLQNTCSSGVFSGAGNRIVGSASDLTFRDVIIGGHQNRICLSSCDSSIIGGCLNVISYSNDSSIISGCHNTITNNSNNSAIIGGVGLTLDNESNKVLVPQLKIDQVSINLVDSKMLTIDSCGNVNFRAFDSFTSSGGIVVGATESMTGFMNQIYASSNGSVVGGGYNCVCCNSNNSSIIGGVNNHINNCSVSTSIIGGHCNFANYTCDSSVIGGYCNSISTGSCCSTILGGRRNSICFGSESSTIIGGYYNNIRYGSCRSSIVSGISNCTLYSRDSVISGGHNNRMYNNNGGVINGGDWNRISDGCSSGIFAGAGNRITSNAPAYALRDAIVGGHCNRICNYTHDSVIMGGNRNCLMGSSNCSSILGGIYNTIQYSCNSTIVGGSNNQMCCSHCSTVVGGYNNRICGYDGNRQYGSSILGGLFNHICDSTDNSSIIGGYSNVIYGCSNYSTIVGGCNNGVCGYSYNSTVIGGFNNYICCSNNSVILGGSDLSICRRPNTVFLNGTTNFKQTVEVAISGTVSSSPYSVNFNEGAVKYLSTLSTDFQVDFTNIPTISNTTITYTLILNQGVSPYMITGLTINGGGLEIIKWANSTAPEGNVNQVDIVGLMFIYDGTGTLVQILGQMGTFA